jgi:uncharacterized membrane protein YfcA
MPAMDADPATAFPLALLPLISFAISVFTSTGGVSGAFLLLPFQVSVLGLTAPSVSATNQLYNVVAIPGGVARYLREGRLVWPLTWVVVAGTLPGVLVGALIRVVYLPDPRSFKTFASLVLLYIGGRMIRDLLSKRAVKAIDAERRFARLVSERRRLGASLSPGDPLPRVEVRQFSWQRIAFEFHGEVHEVSTAGIALLSLAVGVVGGIYGIGGGAIMAPFLVSVFGLPVYTVAGASLAGTLVTSVAGVVFYQSIAPFFPHLEVAPVWGVGLLLGVGGLAGTYSGARLQKHLPASVIKWMLVLIIIATAALYLVQGLR